MFRQLQNIDSAFKYIRFFSLAFLIANCVICTFVIYSFHQQEENSLKRVYIIRDGKLLEAIAADKSQQLSVELRDHIKMFHFYFYSLDPDDAVIKNHITKALYLADGSAKSEYDNLVEKGYYSSIISGNISQVVNIDSIRLNIDQAPYYFRYYGHIKIIRTTSIAIRSLITEGYIRKLDAVSDNNPHGFLIERWNIIDNTDLSLEKR